MSQVSAHSLVETRILAAGDAEAVCQSHSSTLHSEAVLQPQMLVVVCTAGRQEHRWVKQMKPVALAQL